jgi:hypothetical protein
MGIRKGKLNPLQGSKNGTQRVSKDRTFGPKNLLYGKRSPPVKKENKVRSKNNQKPYYRKDIKKKKPLRFFIGFQEMIRRIPKKAKTGKESETQSGSKKCQGKLTNTIPIVQVAYPSYR